MRAAARVPQHGFVAPHLVGGQVASIIAGEFREDLRMAVKGANVRVKSQNPERGLIMEKTDGGGVVREDDRVAGLQKHLQHLRGRHLAGADSFVERRLVPDQVFVQSSDLADQSQFVIFGRTPLLLVLTEACGDVTGSRAYRARQKDRENGYSIWQYLTLNMA